MSVLQQDVIREIRAGWHRFCGLSAKPLEEEAQITARRIQSLYANDMGALHAAEVRVKELEQENDSLAVEVERLRLEVAALQADNRELTRAYYTRNASAEPWALPDYSALLY